MAGRLLCDAGGRVGESHVHVYPFYPAGKSYGMIAVKGDKNKR